MARDISKLQIYTTHKSEVTNSMRDRQTVPRLWRNSPQFSGLEVSSPLLKIPATCPYREPRHSSPFPHILFLEDIFQFYHPISRRFSKLTISLIFPHRSPVCISSVSHTCHILRPSHSSLFDHPNNIWWWVVTMKLLTVQFSPVPFYLAPLKPKYLLRILFSKTPSPHISLSVKDLASHCTGLKSLW